MSLIKRVVSENKSMRKWKGFAIMAVDPLRKILRLSSAIMIALTIVSTQCISPVIATEGGIAEETALIVWESCRSDDIRKTLPSEYIAYACGMEPWEFDYMARVIQAESNGTYDWSDFEDKVLIAAVIFNRKADSRFYNSISGVLDEPGQFTTTSGGWCSTSSSESSRWAIVEAERRLLAGEIPSNLLYFNCVGYNYGTPYGCYGGNYFMTA